MDHALRWLFSRNKGGASVVLDSPTGDRLKYIVQVLYGENITNNAMEYEGLLAGLRAAIGLGINKIIVKGDSQLVIKQVTLPKIRPSETIQ